MWESQNVIFAFHISFYYFKLIMYCTSKKIISVFWGIMKYLMWRIRPTTPRKRANMLLALDGMPIQAKAHLPHSEPTHKYCILYLLAPPNLQKAKANTSLSVYLYILQYFIHLCKNFTASQIFADGHVITLNKYIISILCTYWHICMWIYLHCDFHSTESTLLKKYPTLSACLTHMCFSPSCLVTVIKLDRTR